MTTICARDPLLPAAQGLYDPAYEHDSCGVGFVVDMKGRKSHSIVEMGLRILINLDHRGAVGADAKLGDGCGILVQIPHGFFADECAKQNFTLPAPGEYGIGMIFMPRDASTRTKAEELFSRVIEEEGLKVLGWRDVPVDNGDLGDAVKAVEPVHRQVFIGRGAGATDEDDFERRLYVARKAVSRALHDIPDRAMREYYPVSMSCRTIVYKGLLLATRLGQYYRDLNDERFRSALALVHQRPYGGDQALTSHVLAVSSQTEVSTSRRSTNRR